MASAARAVTYSIVARDAETGELGVAVQSRAFRAGSGVGCALPGVGAVASQAFSERSYGPLGLELLQAGKTPEQALAGLVAADPESAVRQVAMVDAESRTAVHTGTECIREAGHRTGDGYSVQANMMRSTDVWHAMAEAFEAATGSLARRAPRRARSGRGRRRRLAGPTGGRAAGRRRGRQAVGASLGSPRRRPCPAAARAPPIARSRGGLPCADALRRASRRRAFRRAVRGRRALGGDHRRRPGGRPPSSSGAPRAAARGGAPVGGLRPGARGPRSGSRRRRAPALGNRIAAAGLLPDACG